MAVTTVAHAPEVIVAVPSVAVPLAMVFVTVPVTATNWLEELVPTNDADAGTGRPLTLTTVAAFVPEVVTSPESSEELSAEPLDLRSPAENELWPVPPIATGRAVAFMLGTAVLAVAFPNHVCAAWLFREAVTVPEVVTAPEGVELRTVPSPVKVTEVTVPVAILQSAEATIKFPLASV